VRLIIWLGYTSVSARDCIEDENIDVSQSTMIGCEQTMFKGAGQTLDDLIAEH